MNVTGLYSKCQVPGSNFPWVFMFVVLDLLVNTLLCIHIFLMMGIHIAQILCTNFLLTLFDGAEQKQFLSEK